MFTKEKIWRFETNFPVEAPASVSEDSVIFGTTGGIIYSLNRHDGTLNWKFQTNSAILSAPLVHNGVAYVLSLNNKVSAVNLMSGELLWTYGQFTVENVFRRHNTSITLGVENIFIVSIVTGSGKEILGPGSKKRPVKSKIRTNWKNFLRRYLITGSTSI